MTQIDLATKPIASTDKTLSVAYCLLAHSDTHEIGGMERLMMGLAAAVAKTGTRVQGLIPTVPTLDPIEHFCRRHHINTHRIVNLSGEDVRALVRDWLQLFSLLRTLKPDVVHFHRALPRFGKWSILAARAAGVPVIVTTDHDIETSDRGGRIHHWRDNLADQLLDAVVVASEYNRRAQIEQVSRSERLIHRIYCGIDLGKFPLRTPESYAAAREVFGITSDTPVIGTVARLVENKRIGDLLTVAARLSATFPRLHVLVSGEGPLLTQLQSQAAELGIAERVNFLGYYPDVSEVMRALDVFVLPSEWEGFGLVAAEAMASGAPVVATRAGGLPEVIGHGSVGQLVEIGDLDGLTAAVTRYLGDAEFARHTAGIARSYVETNFSDTAMATYTTQLYRSLLTKKRRLSAT